MIAALSIIATILAAVKFTKMFEEDRKEIAEAKKRITSLEIRIENILSKKK